MIVHNNNNTSIDYSCIIFFCKTKKLISFGIWYKCVFELKKYLFHLSFMVCVCVCTCKRHIQRQHSNKDPTKTNMIIIILRYKTLVSSIISNVFKVKILSCRRRCVFTHFYNVVQVSSSLSHTTRASLCLVLLFLHIWKCLNRVSILFLVKHKGIKEGYKWNKKFLEEWTTNCSRKL